MVGDKIKKLREEKKLTQSELANAIGVAQSTIAMIESGKNKGSNDTLIKLAKFFNVSIDYLLNTEEKLLLATESLEKINKLVKENLGEYRDNKILTLAAHFEGEDFTDEDIRDIKNFIDYVLSKKKK